jgi:hypothetical protein
MTDNTKTQKVKAISLWQPWAHFVAEGVKTWETRHYPTMHRGLLAVHAAKTKTGIKITGSDKKFPSFPLLAESHFGALLCIVKLRCVFTTIFLNNSGSQFVNEKNKALGDWRSGRFGWQLEMIKKFDEPIPCKGRQGFFYVDIPEGLL